MQGKRRRSALFTVASAGIVLAAAGVVTAVSASAAAGCRVDYTAQQWAGGFGANVTVTNFGDPINGWTLAWSYPDGQTAGPAWNAELTQSGNNVTARNVDYNAAIATNGSVSFGFNGTTTSSNPPPTAFTLNGVACTGGVTNPTTGGPAPTTPGPGPTTPTPSPTGGNGRWSNNADGFAQGTTGGAGGTTVTVTNYADLVRYATSSAPYIIKVSGTVTSTTMGAEIKVASNKTIVGVGTTGRLSRGGFFIGAGVKNVIIRNLTIGDTAMADDDPDDKTYDYDGIQLDTASNIWIDHNTFQNINDGYIDSRKDTTNITVSWNRMGNHNKTFGIGWTENVTARMTIHHNYIWNSRTRNPSADNLQYVHLYNNYLSNAETYGNYSRGATRMVVENSYFEKVNNPLQRDSTAQLRQSGSIFVSCTGTQSTSGAAFTPSTFYSYTLDKAADVPNLVRTYAGPQADIVY